MFNMTRAVSVTAKDGCGMQVVSELMSLQKLLRSLLALGAIYVLIGGAAHAQNLDQGKSVTKLLRIVARHVIAAHAVLPTAASVLRSSCSCKSTTRAIRARPGRSPLIWSPSIVHRAANREPPRQGRRLWRLAHHGPRSVHPRRCRGIRSGRRVTEAPPLCPDGCRMN